MCCRAIKFISRLKFERAEQVHSNLGRLRLKTMIEGVYIRLLHQQKKCSRRNSILSLLMVDCERVCEDQVEIPRSIRDNSVT